MDPILEGLLASVVGTVLLGWLGWITATVIRIDKWCAAQQIMIETCWSAYMTNAGLKVVSRGLGEMKSPLTNIAPEIRQLYDDLGFTVRLQKCYQECHAMTPTEFEMEVERRFRPEFVEKICKPLGWSDGECVAVAVCIAREPVVGAWKKESDKPTDTRLGK